MPEPSIREVPQAAGPLMGFLTDVVKAVRKLFAEFPSKKELAQAGIISLSGGSVQPPSAPQSIVPPAPIGVAFVGAISNVLVEFDAPAYSGHAYSELLRGDTDSYGDAVVVSRINGAVGAYPTGPDKQGYFWVRHVSSTDTPGQPNNQAGTLVKTAQDPTDLFNALSSAARDEMRPYSEFAVRADDFTVVSPTTDQPVFTVVTTPYTNNGVNVPVGVYFADGFILRGSIVNAAIANAAIDNAKIANVSASKITAGSIAVGENIQSSNYVAGSQGWRINGNGSAEFSDVVVRGSIFSGQGEIGGITIGSNYLQSSNYVIGTSGFRLNSSGAAELLSGSIGGVQIGSNSVRAGQTAYNTGTGFFLGSDGKLSVGSPTGPGVEFDGDSVAIRSGALGGYYYNDGTGSWVFDNFYDFEVRHNGQVFLKRSAISGQTLVSTNTTSITLSITNASMTVGVPSFLGRIFVDGTTETFPGDSVPGAETILDGYFCRAIPTWTLSGASALTWGITGNVTVYVVPCISWKMSRFPNRETQQSLNGSSKSVGIYFEVWATTTKVDDPFTINVSGILWALYRA